MASISLNSVQKSYGTVAVLHDVSLTIADGEFVVLVGPSGCGKSTLLRMIAGLESISGGEIIIADRVVNDMPPKQRDIAMVFQSYALYPHMTVAQNMGFSLKVAGGSQKEIDEKVARAAGILGLEALLGRRPSELSGGQRQRVAMGRAIVRDPAVFLFDEPLSNLDAQLRVQMRAEIKALHRRLGTTMVYVTHDQIEAMTMADRIVVMNQGNLEQIGSPLELFDRPANVFVARFLGSPTMNMIDGRLIQRDGGQVFLSDHLEVAVNTTSEIPSGREVVLGFRPEHLSLGAAPGPGTLTTEVMVIEPTGTETLLNLRAGPNIIIAAFRDRIDLAPGESISLGLNTERLHLFDKATGERMN